MNLPVHSCTPNHSNCYLAVAMATNPTANAYGRYCFVTLTDLGQNRNQMLNYPIAIHRSDETIEHEPIHQCTMHNETSKNCTKDEINSFIHEINFRNHVMPYLELWSLRYPRSRSRSRSLSRINSLRSL